MKLFNSKTNHLEVFNPIEANKVSMYVCGPTVYGEAHIGNARPIIVFDTLRNTFEALGYSVDYLSNFTDVDDKIIQKAIQEKTDEKTITKRYIQAYTELRDALHTQKLDFIKVTDTMDEIIAFIDQLVKSDFAYNIDGDVYFRVSKVEDYGIISKQRIDDLIVGARVEEEVKKESPLDFALWKKTKDGIQWDSPWGKGRPGWHTECVVMIDKHFHHQIDIHGGGMDLKFPHHENELAQSKAGYHHDLANIWMHNGMLNIDGEKMSKSIGNILLAKDMVAKIGANAVRWMMLSAHYRSPLNVSESVLEQAQTEIIKIETVLKQVEIKTQLKGIQLISECETVYYAQFLEALSDDLNTPNALKIILDICKELNQVMRNPSWDNQILSGLYHSLRKMLAIGGMIIEPVTLSENQLNLYHAWDKAKLEKDFTKADALRKQLIEEQVLV